MKCDHNVIGKRGGRRIAFLSVLAVMLLSVTVLMFVNTGDEVSGANPTQEVVGNINYEVIMNGADETDTVMVIALPNNEKYQGKIEIPATVKFSNGVTYNVIEIGEKAFYECLVLTSVVIPNSVVTIGNYAFYCCYALTSIDIPKGVETIGNYAFSYCYVLTSVVIPDSVTTIGEGAFCECYALTSIVIPGSVETIGGYAFQYCYALTSAVIQGGVVTISEGTFYDCVALTSVVIPDSMVTIGKGAFYDCVALTSVVIPDSVVTIGDYAFNNCYALTSVEIPDSVVTIGDYAFYWCYALTSIDIPGGVVTIGKDAFQYCSALTSVVIPDSVTTIGAGAFSGCSALTSVEIPDSVDTIGKDTFFNCTALKTVTISGKGVGTATAVLELFEKDGWTIYTDTTVDVLVIDTSAKLDLKDIKIPDGKMLEFTSNAKNTINGIFYDTDGTTPLTTSAERSGKTFIKNDDGVSWKVGEIVFKPAFVFENAGDGVLVSMAPDSKGYKGPLTIPSIDGSTGKSVVGIADSGFAECKGITSVVIPKGVVTIGNSAFFDCYALTSVEIPDSVVTIGYSAFFDCFALTSIAIPNSVETIGDYAFNSCVALTSIAIPNSVETIGDYAFQYCYALTSIAIPNSVTTIGKCAFYYCYALTSVVMPNSVVTIGDYAFYCCYALTSIDIPGGVVTIGNNAFQYCYALTSVVIPGSVETIGDYAFQYCYALTSVVIPGSVETIGDYAFQYCYALTSVTISALGDGDGSVLSKYFTERSWILSESPEITTLTIDTSDEINVGNIGMIEGKTLILSKKATNTIGQEGKMFCNGIEVTGKERAGKTYTAIEGNWISYAEYNVKLTTNSDEYGSVRGSGTYAYGSNVTIRAIANDGYQFVSWSDGNTSATRNLTITSDVSLKATFADTSAVVYVVNITIEGKGQVYVTGTFEEGSVVTLYAVAENGHSFQKWSHTSSTSTLVSFQLFADMNITATFSSDSAFGGNGNGMTIDNTTAMMIIIIVVAALALLIVVVVIRGKAR